MWGQIATTRTQTAKAGPTGDDPNAVSAEIGHLRIGNIEMKSRRNRRVMLHLDG